MAPETIKLPGSKIPGSTEEKITVHKNGENVPHLENTEMALVDRNIVNDKYQRDSWVLSTFVPIKSFGLLLNISPMNHIYTETFRSELKYGLLIKPPKPWRWKTE